MSEAFTEWRVYYRTAGDGRAPALLTLPSPDYEKGPRARALSPRDIQIEISRMNAAVSPPPVDDMGYGAVPDEESEEDWLDEAEKVPPPLSIGDAVLRESDQKAFVLAPEGWCAVAWRAGREPKKARG